MKINKKTEQGIEGFLSGYTIYFTTLTKEIKKIAYKKVEAYLKKQDMKLKKGNEEIYIDYSEQDFNENSIKSKIEGDEIKAIIPSPYSSGDLGKKIRPNSFVKGLFKAMIN